MRLDRFLSGATSLTRSEIRRRVAAGEVCVNGAAALHPEMQVDERADTVALSGVTVSGAPLYLMLNKPQGVVSATRDGRDRTVLDLVPPEWRRKNLFPAGRLDRDTEGFVLLTDDGAFAHRILSPKRHVPKTYEAEAEGALLPDTAERFKEGVVLWDGTRCRPAEYRELGRLPDGAVKAEVVLTEGMYHQIKRMFAACGGHVRALRRMKIGALELDPLLGAGECRLITPKELEKILF